MPFYGENLMRNPQLGWPTKSVIFTNLVDSLWGGTGNYAFIWAELKNLDYTIWINYSSGPLRND